MINVFKSSETYNSNNLTKKTQYHFVHFAICSSSNTDSQNDNNTWLHKDLMIFHIMNNFIN